MPINEKKSNKLLVWIYGNLVLVSGLIVIVWFILGYLFVIQAKIQAGNANPEETLEKIQLKLDARQAKLGQLNNLIDDYKNLDTEYIKRLKEFLPSEKDNSIIFTHLDAIARANDSVLLKASAANLNKKDIIDISVKENIELPKDIEISVIDAEFLSHKNKDSYKFFKNLLTNIENSLRLFDIESIDFSPKMETLNFSAKTYFLKDKIEGNE